MLPAGYTQVAWSDVQMGQDIYVLEDGRDKPYGPYRVLDATSREVQDVLNGLPYGNAWTITVGETIGIPDSEARRRGIGHTAPPNAAYSSVRLAAASVIDAVYDFTVVRIASQNSKLSPHEQQRLANEADALRQKAIDLLTALVSSIP